MDIIIRKKDNNKLPTIINFIELVNNSSTTLTLNYKSEMITLLTEEFTEEQLQWYIINLFIYLNYHPTDDFLINLENIFRMLGFANKGNAMKTIKSNFTIDVDYKTVIIRSEKNLNNKDLGGRPTEEVMLNVDTFKTLCMLVKTDKGAAIRSYYIKMERIHNKVVKLEMDNTHRLLKEKELIIQEKDEIIVKTNIELNRTQVQLKSKTKLKVKRWYDTAPGDTVYGVNIKIKASNETFIKLGKTLKANKRETQYPDDMFYIRKCYNCVLAEKVIHHILDKFRIENNKEYFDITEKLAIYTIDIVCDFLDKFINFSEELPNSNLKENMSLSLELIEELSKEVKETIKTEIIMKETDINKIVNIKTDVINETEMIDKFINEYCEIDETYECLNYEILGAYRIWSGGLNNKSKANLSKHLKSNYRSKSKFYEEYNNSVLLTYIGIRPKTLSLKQDDNKAIYKYEEFILTECKYNYNYRIGWTEFIDELTKWTNQKYPEYVITDAEKKNIIKYINKHFLKDKINMLGFLNVPGIWGFQMKNNNNFVLQANNKLRKVVCKINVLNNTIVSEYESLIQLSQILNIGRGAAARYIKIKKIIDDHFYQYKEDIEINHV